MAKLFGTDGIRGRANREPLVPETLARIGRALGDVLRAEGGRKRVLIGRDTRLSGAMVESAVAAGLLATGVSVTTCGVLSTPGIARLTLSGRFGLGIVVSASHNPADDNGVKVFLRNARKPGPEWSRGVEERVSNGRAPEEVRPGTRETWHGAATAYVDVLLGDFADLDLTGTTIAMDCANGATCSTAVETGARTPGRGR